MSNDREQDKDKRNLRQCDEVVLVCSTKRAVLRAISDHIESANGADMLISLLASNNLQIDTGITNSPPVTFEFIFRRRYRAVKLSFSLSRNDSEESYSKSLPNKPVCAEEEMIAIVKNNDLVATRHPGERPGDGWQHAINFWQTL